MSKRFESKFEMQKYYKKNIEKKINNACIHNIFFSKKKEKNWSRKWTD